MENRKTWLKLFMITVFHFLVLCFITLDNVLEFGFLGSSECINSLGCGYFSVGLPYYTPLVKIGKISIELPLNAGYARMFGKGTAVHFGSGLDFIFSNSNYGIRFEAKDFFKWTGDNEHNIVFRIAFLCLIHS